ncbi:MAG: hypothetical protein IIV90_04305, partial [Oscillospiraceae bacterium]|nr:hypothetical protein [Oscillospiraceae bacterium]
PAPAPDEKPEETAEPAPEPDEKPEETAEPAPAPDEKPEETAEPAPEPDETREEDADGEVADMVNRNHWKFERPADKKEEPKEKNDKNGFLNKFFGKG